MVRRRGRGPFASCCLVIFCFSVLCCVPYSLHLLFFSDRDNVALNMVGPSSWGAKEVQEWVINEWVIKEGYHELEADLFAEVDGQALLDLSGGDLWSLGGGFKDKEARKKFLAKVEDLRLEEFESANALVAAEVVEKKKSYQRRRCMNLQRRKAKAMEAPMC